MSNEDSPLVSLDDSTIIPASITISPNLYHQGSGLISLASSVDTDFSASASYDLFTSWRIMGSLEVDVTTSWNVGAGAWYWYRVEGECGPVECETFGMSYNGCNRMRFVTTVSARNLSELCDTLQNPRTNAPVNLKIATIQKYSRPVFRGSTPADECNIMQEVEFCHIPECLDYCPEEAAPFLGIQNIVVAYEDVPAEPEFPTRPIRVEDKMRAATDISEVLVSRASVDSSVLGLGYEYDESLSEGDMYPSTDLVSACGCTAIGEALSMRHSLNRSSAMADFISSTASHLPSKIDLMYRASESSWNSIIHLGDPIEGWRVLFGFGCQDNLWRLSFSALAGRKQTRLVVDIPPELMCASRRPSAPVQVYFSQRPFVPKSDGVQVVAPSRTPRKTALFSAEVFVEGIFVPHVVYYDELGLFKDSFWEHSPLELDINPASKNPITLMTLNGIA